MTAWQHLYICYVSTLNMFTSWITVIVFVRIKYIISATNPNHFAQFFLKCGTNFRCYNCFFFDVVNFIDHDARIYRWANTRVYSGFYASIYSWTDTRFYCSLFTSVYCVVYTRVYCGTDSGFYRKIYTRLYRFRYSRIFIKCYSSINNSLW